MIDISKQTVKVDCPECNRAISVTLKQIANEALIKCNCGQEIQLKDNNGTNKTAIKDVNKSFKDLERTLKSFGK